MVSPLPPCSSSPPRTSTGFPLDPHDRRIQHQQAEAPMIPAPARPVQAKPDSPTRGDDTGADLAPTASPYVEARKLFPLFLRKPSLADSFFRSRVRPDTMSRLESLIASLRDPLTSNETLEHLLIPGDQATIRYIDDFLWPVLEQDEKAAESPGSGPRPGVANRPKERIRMKGSWWILLGAWVLGEAVRERERRARSAKADVSGDTVNKSGGISQ